MGVKDKADEGFAVAAETGIDRLRFGAETAKPAMGDEMTVDRAAFRPPTGE